MENSGINLLPEITEKEIKAGVYKRKATVAAIGSLVIIGVVILGLLAYQIYLTVAANSIEDRSKKAEAVILEHQNLEIKSLALKEKVDKIQATLENEIPTSTLLDQVGIAATTNISSPITISGISTQPNGTFTVEGTALGSAVFSQWIDNLTNQTGKDYFGKINLVTLTGSPGNYKFTFQMDFLNKGVYKASK